MKSRSVSFCPLVVLLLAGICSAQNAQSPVSVRGPVNVAEREWAKVVPALQQAGKQRLAMGNEVYRRLLRSATELCSSTGRKAFIDEALSLKSKQLMMTNQQQHRAWLRRLYLEHVFPLEAFQKQILLCSSGLTDSMQKIDNALLVECFVDVEDFPKVTRPMPLDLVKLNRAVDQEIDGIVKTVYDSTAKQVISFSTSWVASEVAQNAARDAMRDENGQSSWLAEIISLGIATAVDDVVQELADELLETHKALDKHLQESTDKLLTKCLVEGTAGQLLKNQMLASIHAQENGMGHLIIDYLEVDEDWAVRYYNAILNQSSK